MSLRLKMYEFDGFKLQFASDEPQEIKGRGWLHPAVLILDRGMATEDVHKLLCGTRVDGHVILGVELHSTARQPRYVVTSVLFKEKLA